MNMSALIAWRSGRICSLLEPGRQFRRSPRFALLPDAAIIGIRCHLCLTLCPFIEHDAKTSMRSVKKCHGMPHFKEQAHVYRPDLGICPTRPRDRAELRFWRGDEMPGASALAVK